MTNEERKILFKAIKDHRKQVLSSKESALQFLVSAGWCNKDGSLVTPPKR